MLAATVPPGAQPLDQRPHAGLGDQHDPGPLVGRQRRGTRAASRPSAPPRRWPAPRRAVRPGAGWRPAAVSPYPRVPSLCHAPSLSRCQDLGYSVRPLARVAPDGQSRAGQADAVRPMVPSRLITRFRPACSPCSSSCPGERCAAAIVITRSRSCIDPGTLRDADTAQFRSPPCSGQISASPLLSCGAVRGGRPGNADTWIAHGFCELRCAIATGDHGVSAAPLQSARRSGRGGAPL